MNPSRRRIRAAGSPPTSRPCARPRGGCCRGPSDSRAARGQFAAFLGQAGLTGKRTITTAEQASTAAKADGKNALDERVAAEEAWKTKQYETVLDARAIYATGTPHLAAFQMAARNAGYTDAEIAMRGKPVEVGYCRVGDRCETGE